MELIRKYFDLRSDEECLQKIDDSTCGDLNVDELFDAIDCTYSPIGKQYLYNLIRTIPHKSKIKLHEQWLKQYSENEELKTKTNKLLKKLDRSDSYYLYPMIVRDFVPFSTAMQILLRVLQFVPSILLALFILTNSGIAIISFIVSIIVNMIVHFWAKQIAFLNASAVPFLFKLIDTSETLNKVPQIKELDLDISKHLENIKTLKKRLSFFRYNAKLESEFAAIFWIISELVRIFFLFEPINLNNIFTLIKANKESLAQIFDFVGLIDSLQSVATLRNEVPYYCHPQFSENDNNMDVTEMYHPLIDNCVSNSFSLDKQSFLVMGSNMSGKTSFVRTLGLNVLMAQTLNMSFARSMSLNKQKIYSAIAVNDSLMEGHSYYLSEVLRIKNIIEQSANGANLILLDELFKGTNTIERVAGAKAVLDYLSQNPKNRVLVATHDIELTALLKNKYQTIYFTENIRDKELSFEYKIKYEYTNFRNAIKILELYDFPNSIVKDALFVADNHTK